MDKRDNAFKFLCLIAIVISIRILGHHKRGLGVGCNLVELLERRTVAIVMEALP
jgi:hypothetical protein